MRSAERTLENRCEISSTVRMLHPIYEDELQRLEAYAQQQARAVAQSG